MKIAGLEVTNVQRNKAWVGGQEVSREDLKDLLTNMDSAPATSITLRQGTPDYVGFTIKREYSGWVSIMSETYGYSAAEAHFCLDRDLTTRLRNFLSTEIQKRGW